MISQVGSKDKIIWVNSLLGSSILEHLLQNYEVNQDFLVDDLLKTQAAFLNRYAEESGQT
jgi:hypothetical protein